MKYALVISLVFSFLLALAACSEGEPEIVNDAAAKTQVEANTVTGIGTNSNATADSVRRLRTVSSDYMNDLLASSPNLQLMAGKPVAGFPDHSLSSVRKQVEFFKELQRQLETIDKEALPYNERLSYSMLARELSMGIEAQAHFWLGFDVMPYQCGSLFSSFLPVVLNSWSFESGGATSGYLSFLKDLGRFVNDQHRRLQEQAERGILMPKAALPGVRKIFQNLRKNVPLYSDIPAERLSALDQEQRRHLMGTITETLNADVFPAIDDLLAFIGEDYESRAPMQAGLGQYPGGEAAYRFAIRRETTLDLDPQVIHRRGLEYLAQIQDRMAAIRNELGFKGSAAEFHAQMRKDSRFYAQNPEEVEARYMDYIKRIEPHIPRYFSILPKAPYGVKRLDRASEEGMTFGYYQAPSPSVPVGRYLYNGSELDSRPLVSSGALIYHELIPGHHFHIALQRENESLSEFRKLTGFMYPAFTEGWATYAASLAYDMGIMKDPYERYGWQLVDSFIATRLVVDTGMNYLGWSLEKARQFMRANTFSSEQEVATETLRYATDMPAQALAYKLGYEKFQAIRARTEERLEGNFDIKDFHAAVLSYGAMPLPLLEEHIKAVLP